MNKKNPKHGFTIVEILIVAPIVILVIGAFISVIVSMTGDVLSARGSNALAFNIQDALNLIEQDVTSSGAFLATNNITITSPQGYNNDTTYFHNVDATNGTMLILNSYATTTNPLTSARSIIYETSPNACNSARVDQNQPIMINIVYFVKDNTLWRRVIMPSNYATVGCSVPWQQPSCAPRFTTPSFCKTQDTQLVDGIQTNGFIVNYYKSPSSITPANSNDPLDSVRQTALQTTNTVSITINATNTVAGRDISQSGTIRSVSPNNNKSSGAQSRTSCWAILNAGESTGNGIYLIYPTGSDGLQVYCDMTTSGGGWTLIVSNPGPYTAWNLTNVYSFNASSPSISALYSILNKANSIKSNLSGNLQYRIDAVSFGHWGGVWQAPFTNTFVGISVVNNATNIEKYDAWTIDTTPNDTSSLSNIMPWIGNSTQILSTWGNAGSWWGTFVSGGGYSPAPYIYPEQQNPGIIWYWVK